MTPEDVLDFWHAAGESRWFTRSAVFDGQLSVRFKEALAKARDGAFDHWTETPEGTLALIILLDQFSRNIYRGTPLAFAADHKALASRRRRWRAATISPCRRRSPAGSSCPSSMPRTSTRKCAAWRCFSVHDPGDMTHWARLHLDIIARFGRFPHRNAILGRKSTPEELAFLASGGFAG